MTSAISISSLYGRKCCRNTNLLFSRCVSVKRKYPLDPAAADKLPVFEYPHDNRFHRLYAWGHALTGALGSQPKPNKGKFFRQYLHKPVRLTFAEIYEVRDITCGYGFTAYTVKSKRSYKVFGSGLNSHSQIGYHAPRRGHHLDTLLLPAAIDIPFKSSSTKVKQISAGREHLVVVTDKEGVFTLGSNQYGQCGRRIVESENYNGSQLIYNIKPIDEIPFISAQSGQHHTLLINEKGEVYGFGWNKGRELNVESDWKPKKMEGDIKGENIVKIAGFGDTVLALNDKGEAFGWGSSECCQLNKNSASVSVPQYLKFSQSLGKIVDIAAGDTHCIALNDAGEVFSWGYGILGKGPNMNYSHEPSLIPSTLFGKNEFQPDSIVTNVYSGTFHMMAMTNYGDIYGWGKNIEGSLGIGHRKEQYFPFKVALGGRVVKVSCGADHTVAMCKSFL